jgi:YgiT-type zinc finger domain-containing protein
MRCVICGEGETQRGLATLVLERGGLTMVLKSVPAEVCENCGEEYVDEAVTAAVLAKAERAASEGVQVEVREYVAA